MLTFMVMLFIGNKSDVEFRMAKKLLSAYGAIHPEVYESVKHHCHELRVANGIDNPSSPKQLEEFHADLNSTVKEILSSRPQYSLLLHHLSPVFIMISLYHSINKNSHVWHES